MKSWLRSFFFIAFVLAVFGGGCSPALPAERPEPAAVPFHITLSWTADSRTTQTVTWQTIEPVPGKIRFAPQRLPQSSGGEKTIAAAVRAVDTNRGIRYIHSATLTGLQPGVRYRYRVGGGAAWSESHSFTVAADHTEFRFLVFGDSQSVRYDTWQRTLASAYQAYPDAAFMTIVGDLVDVGQDYGEWQAWFRAGKGVLAALPLMPLPGNHESYTPERTFSPPQLFTGQFSLPLNGPEGMKEQAYSFDYGGVHFVMLDTQAGEQRQFLPDLLERQAVWLEADLTRSTAKWKIVFMHRPPYDNKSFRDNTAVRRAFTPLFDKHRIDLVISGHDHVYARTYPLVNGAVASSGTVYTAAGRSGTKFYTTTAANPLNAVFYNPGDEPNYLAVTVTANTIAVRAVKQSGGLIDAWQITKSE